MKIFLNYGDLKKKKKKKGSAKRTHFSIMGKRENK